MNEEFSRVFTQLKKILAAYDQVLSVTQDEQNYYLKSKKVDKSGKSLCCGSVIIGKNYVSYHLMPVYMYPDLLKDISESLKKRMQGKSCFNFKTCNATLFDELEE